MNSWASHFQNQTPVTKVTDLQKQLTCSIAKKIFFVNLYINTGSFSLLYTVQLTAYFLNLRKHGNNIIPINVY